MKTAQAIQSETITLTIPREVVALAMFAYKGEDRESLQYVMVEQRRAGVLVAVATDGYRLAMFEFPGTLDYPIYLHAETMKSLKAKTEIVFSQTGQVVTLAAGRVRAVQPFFDGSFPDYQRIIPKVDIEAKIHAIGFDAVYLMDAVKWAKAAGFDTTGGVKLEFGENELSAIKVTLSEVEGFVYILMPMRTPKGK